MILQHGDEVIPGAAQRNTYIWFSNWLDNIQHLRVDQRLGFGEVDAVSRRRGAGSGPDPMKLADLGNAGGTWRGPGFNGAWGFPWVVEPRVAVSDFSYDEALESGKTNARKRYL